MLTENITMPTENITMLTENITMPTENIKIAILGPISAGKTTFFSSLCSNKMSDMMRKKTTMLPQIYQIGDGEFDPIETIYERNKTSNENILSLRENGEFNINRDFTELVHKMNPIPDFIQLPDIAATYSILDMPGLNCGGDSLYYDYIRRISSTIDIYLLVFDINSSLNTTDEINILKLVAELVNINNNGYVHILINKCDNIQFDGDVVDLQDQELNNIYSTCEQIIKKHFIEIGGEEIMTKVTITPLCSNKLYHYRCNKNNVTTIDEAELNIMIKEDCGNSGLAKYTTISAKRQYVSELVNSDTYNEYIKNTGYNKFLYALDNILKNYSEMIFYHINADVAKLNNMIKIDFDIIYDQMDFDTIYDQMDIINTRIKRALQYSRDAATPPQYLLDNLDIINKRLDSYLLARYSRSSVETIDKILLKMNSYCAMLSNLFTTNEIENSKLKLSEVRIHLLSVEFESEFNYDIFLELYCGELLPIELFEKSICNTFQNSMNNVVGIYNSLLHHDDKYVCKFIQIFVISLDGYKIRTEVFLEFLPKLIPYFEDLTSISIAITNFMITNFTSNYYSSDDSGCKLYTKKVCTYWRTLNASRIAQSSHKVQYIYFISRTFGTYQSVDSIFDKVDFATYSQTISALDSIFSILTTSLDVEDNSSDIEDNEV